jgi:hypothetical protein
MPTSRQRQFSPFKKGLPPFKMGRPQQLALLLLFVFLGQCLWVISHQHLTEEDYRYARCGREMWERPSPLAGYFTTCGNLNGDGTFAYRLAGAPLTAQRLLLLGIDHFRKPEDRLYPGGTLNGSTYESRHQLSYVLDLMHLPFVFFAMWLGGGLWWVARRLFGDEGGAFALTLYCFSPAVIRAAVLPNNEILAMWGLYGIIYTAIGVAHAMHGPRRKWKPRIALLILALGLTAAAHLLAAIVGLVASVILMLYLAERRRTIVLLILTYAAFGALILDFAFFSFRPSAFYYVIAGGSARFWLSLEGPRAFASDPMNGPLLIAFGIAAVVFFGFRRSRYFGNTVPLTVVLALAFLVTTQTLSAPILWAIPFLLTFIGGVFADVLEIKHRRLFAATAILLVLCQVLASLGSLTAIARG